MQRSEGHGRKHRSQTWSPRALSRRLLRRRATTAAVSMGVILSVPAAAAQPPPTEGPDETAASRPPPPTHAGESPDVGAAHKRDDPAPASRGADRPAASTDRPAATTDHDLGSRLVLDTAARYEGTPYKWGAEGPKAFDCSGYTMRVFAQLGVQLPHGAQEQYEKVRRVPKQDMRPGDLVFTYDENGDIYHVGIHAGRLGGDELMWAATKPKDVVRLQRMWTDRYVVGRV